MQCSVNGRRQNITLYNPFVHNPPEILPELQWHFCNKHYYTFPTEYFRARKQKYKHIYSCTQNMIIQSASNCKRDRLHMLGEGRGKGQAHLMVSRCAMRSYNIGSSVAMEVLSRHALVTTTLVSSVSISRSPCLEAVRHRCMVLRFLLLLIRCTGIDYSRASLLEAPDIWTTA